MKGALLLLLLNHPCQGFSQHIPKPLDLTGSNLNLELLMVDGQEQHVLIAYLGYPRVLPSDLALMRGHQ